MADAPLFAPPSGQAEAYRQLLVKLNGIFAANVRMDERGVIEEIHILGSSLRSPKQIMRDVQSALSSSFGVYVDHRLISVAQLKEDPVPEVMPQPLPQAMDFRLCCHEVSEGVSQDTDTYWVKVALCQNDIPYVGKATCKNTALQRSKAIVNAALQAVCAFLGGESLFETLAVQQTQLSQIKVIVVALESLVDYAPPILIGAAENTGNEALCTVRATLDALNRRICYLSRRSLS